MNIDEYISELKPILKQIGFKKYGKTWRKQQSESVAVFNVQLSQWGSGDFYINLGTYFTSLGENESPNENVCHVRVRLPVDNPDKVAEKAEKWFKERERLNDAILLSEVDSKKGLVLKILRDAKIT